MVSDQMMGWTRFPRWRSRAAGAGLLVVATGCTSSAGAQLAASAAEALLKAATTPSRSQTGCASACESGTSCNANTGMCEPTRVTTVGPARKPAEMEPDDSCGGMCLEGEHCKIVANADVECVPAASQ